MKIFEPKFSLILFLIAAVVLLCTVTTLAQKKTGAVGLMASESTPLPTMNNLKLVFPAGNVFRYTYHDSTTVHRLYSDSSTLDYSRDIIYYLQMKALKDPSAGILELLVNIDSMDYKFTSGDAVMEYNSQRSNKELTFPDLLAATVPINREFTMKLSPYWEVVSVEGPMLDWLRDYINQYGEGRLDEMRKFIWFNGISTTAMAHFADFQKGAIPGSRVHKDSTWSKPFFIKADGIDCRDDSAKSRIAAYAQNVYTIETKSNHLRVLPCQQRLYRIEQMLDILGGEGKGTHTMLLNKRGVVSEAVSDFTTVIKAQIRKEIFAETVRTIYSWKLLGQMEY